MIPIKYKSSYLLFLKLFDLFLCQNLSLLCNMYHVALIGYGYWGTNLLRNLMNASLVSSLTVCDLKKSRRDEVQKIYPTLQVTDDFESIISKDTIDIVIIATPTSTHYPLAKLALQRGKHTLVEKPLCTSSSQARELYQLANQNQVILFTDLTFLFNGAVEYIQESIKNGALGKINYIDSTRVNLGIYHNDTNVIWDLATHDIAIIQKLLQLKPTHVRAISSHTQKQHTDLAYIFLYYPDDVLVHINSSWASPTKIRQMIIGGEKKMIIYDEVEPTHKVKIYDYAQTDESRNETLIDYRLGDIAIPKFSTTEPLRKMLDTFLECIRTNQYQVVLPEDSIEIIRILECAELSLAKGGDLIPLAWN